MKKSEVMEILRIFDYWNENKPNYYGIPEVKYIYRNEWADPELYYQGEYFNIHDVEDAMWIDFQEYAEENSIEENMDNFSEYMKNNTCDIIEYLDNLLTCRTEEN